MSSSISGTISIESHSKQVKLLNDYILSLEKKLNEGRESDSNRILKLSDEANHLNDDNIRLKNEIAQLKFSLYRQEQIIRKNGNLENELLNLKHLLQKEINEKMGLNVEYQALRERLANCEKHLEAAEQEVNSRTDLFNKDSSHLTDIVENQKKKIEQKTAKCIELQINFQGEKKRMNSQIQNLQKLHNQSIKSKSQAMGKLIQELSTIKSNLGEESKLKLAQISLGEQLRKELEAKCLEIATLVKVNQEVRGRLEAKENEVNSYISILNTKNQEYDRMVKNNSEEKSNLIRIVRRLEDEKRMLESVNSSAKGDISSQIKQNQDLINRNQTLSKEIEGIANQLAVARSQIEVLSNEKEQQKAKIKSLEDSLAEVLAQRDTAHSRLKDLSAAYQLRQKESTAMKSNLEGQIAVRDLRIKKLNQTIEDHEARIKALTKEKDEANEQIGRMTEGKSNSEQYYSNKVQGLEDQLSKSQQEFKETRDRLTTVTSEYGMYQKKKEEAIENLNNKINGFISDQALLKNQFDSTAKDFISFKQAKEQQVIGLNGKIKDLFRQKTSLEDSLQKVKQEFSLSKKRKEEQIEDVSCRLRDLQKEHLVLKDNSDASSRQYYTFQKKKETDIQSLNDRLKEALKKIEKKDLKIEELQEEIKQIEKFSETTKKSLSSTQKEELDRIKTQYITENTSIKKELSEERLKKEEAIGEREQLNKTVQQLQQQIKTVRELFKNKEKSSLQTQRKMEMEQDKLLNEIKNLKISTVMVSQSKNTKEIQIQALKKTIANLESFISEQKKNSENLVKLMTEKQKELQSLQTSNTMLRRQLVSSLNNEESVRKDMVDLRKSGSMIMTSFQQSRQRSAVGRSKGRLPSALVLSKQSLYAESMVKSQDGSNKGSKVGIKKYASRSSIIDEIQKIAKDAQEIPTTPEAEEREETTQI